MQEQRSDAPTCERAAIHRMATRPAVGTYACASPAAASAAGAASAAAPDAFDLLGARLVVVFLAGARFAPAAFFAPAAAPFFAARAAFSASARAFAGQSMFTHSVQGPRAVWIVTSGAPHSGQLSPVAVSAPRCGSG